MILDYTKINHLYLVCGHTDMRKGIDGLAAVIQNQFELDVYQEASLFLFVVDVLIGIKHCFESRWIRIAL